MSYGSLQNLIAARGRTPVIPEIGMGATVLHWTDRTACTITVVSGKTIIVQEDKATRADSNGMSDSQEYTYAPNPEGRKWIFTLRKNGHYVRKGESIKGGQRILIGTRRHYHDYTF